MFAPLMMDYSFLRVPVAARYVEKKKKRSIVDGKYIYTERMEKLAGRKGGKDSRDRLYEVEVPQRFRASNILGLTRVLIDPVQRMTRDIE